MAEYRPLLSQLATEFILSLPKRRQRVAMRRIEPLARHPFHDSDYQLTDPERRAIDHLLVDGFVFSYWIDHASGSVLISEIEDIDST